MARRLIGAGFDLLIRSSDEMRRASFYIGLLLLITAGPFALATWALEVVSFHRTARQLNAILDSTTNGWFDILRVLAVIGFVVAVIESRAMASAILGARIVGRPVTVREALARSRTVFWRIVVGSFIVGIPVIVVQVALSAISVALFGARTDTSLVTSTLAAAIVGAPLAYQLSGIVLGDVDPLEAARRSVRVFRARKLAAILVAVFDSVATLLVVVGLGTGLDLALRVFGALGLGPESGPFGLALMSGAIAVGVFALGSLVFTAYSIAVAPQIVMFVGLTHATFGLDHVRPGGDRDPALLAPGRTRFRWLTRLSLLAFLLGLLGLAAVLVAFGR